MAKTYGLVFTNSDPRSAPAVSLSPTIVSFISCIDGTTSAPPGITKINPNTGLYLFSYTPSFPVFFLADGGTLITDNTQRYLYGILDPVHKVDEQLTQLGSTMQAIGSTLNAIGSSNIALGTTNVALGTTNVALGTTNIALNTSIIAQGSTLVGYAVSTYAAALTLLAQTQTISVNLSLNIAGISLIMQSIGTTASAIGTTSVDPGDLFGYLKRLQEFNEGIQNFNKTSGVWNISTRGNTLFASKTLTNSSTQVNRS